MERVVPLAPSSLFRGGRGVYHFRGGGHGAVPTSRPKRPWFSFRTSVTSSWPFAFLQLPTPNVHPVLRLPQSRRLARRSILLSRTHAYPERECLTAKNVVPEQAAQTLRSRDLHAHVTSKGFLDRCTRHGQPCDILDECIHYQYLSELQRAIERLGFLYSDNGVGTGVGRWHTG